MKILIADNIRHNQNTLQSILEREGYETLTASDGAEAFCVLEKEYASIHAILLNLAIPDPDGLSLIEQIKHQDWFPDIPILAISKGDGSSEEKKALKLGVADFIHEPFVKEIVLHRLQNMIQLYLHKTSTEQLVSHQTMELKKQAEIIQKHNERIIEILGVVVEYRNLECGEHILRVKALTTLMADSMMRLFPERGLTPQMARIISSASSLHDIGKITIPDSIMLKPGKLTPEEYALVKTHTISGAKILQRIEGAWDKEYTKIGYEICRYHHERYDGKGYPDGLKGEEIPLSAQLVSVADVYDALVSKRVYKDAYSPEDSYNMIMAGECGTFSSQILDCFEDAKEEFEKLARIGMSII